MTRSRAPQPEDHVVEQNADRTALFRLFAVEPHGWSTVLVEDQSGAIFQASSATASLIAVPAGDAGRLLSERVYRLWHGSRNWAPLEALPLVATAFARDFMQTELQESDGTG